jgi:hypothetical protein
MAENECEGMEVEYFNSRLKEGKFVSQPRMCV